MIGIMVSRCCGRRPRIVTGLNETVSKRGQFSGFESAQPAIMMPLPRKLGGCGMKRLAVRCLLIAAAMGILAVAVPVTAQAHWRHAHHAWYHGWHSGVSYYPYYAAYAYTYAQDPYAPVCVWNRSWDAFWHRDCF
jgi:hypothetical protein